MSDLATAFPPIVVITGPTAVGKSSLALDLAPRFGAEIVSADSRQVYRQLDIGTAKPTLPEQRAVRHHLIDLVEPDEPYSVANFKADCDRVLLDLARRGRVAFLVGGSPHYVQAVIERLDFPRVPPQEDLRRELEEYARQHGSARLHQRLREVDPTAAEEIAATNVRRVIRALEVCRVTGRPFSEVGRRRGPRLPALQLAITTDRATLYRRIDERIQQQLRDGLLEEARRVLEMAFDPALPPLAGLVYREAIAAVRGEMTVAEAVRRMEETTHAFARRQYTWFRRDPSLQWFELEPELGARVEETVERYLGSVQEAAISRQGRAGS